MRSTGQIRTISFGTPDATRETLFDRAKAVYAESVDDGGGNLHERMFDVLADASANDVAHDVLAHLASELIELNHHRSEINLDLLDYLGDYPEGPILGDLATSPVAGVSETLLTDTINDHDGLRIGTLSVEVEDGILTVGATPRLNDDEEWGEDYDIDRWREPDRHDQMEMREPIPALKFVGLDDETETLVSAFIDLVNEKGNGFAGFYEKSTATNSLLDRINDITLPDPESVRDELDRFVDAKDRAADLDDRIARTDILINEIVYRLYDLDEGEIEVVESDI